MGILTVIGSAIGAYIMGMAALSPCPLLVDNIAGSVIIVSIDSGHASWQGIFSLVCRINSRSETVSILGLT